MIKFILKINVEMKKNLISVLVFAAGIIFFTLTSKAQRDFTNDWKLRNDLPVFSEPEIKPVKRKIFILTLPKKQPNGFTTSVAVPK